MPRTERKWTGFGISIMSWGCPGGGLADLGSPDWYEDLRQKVLGAFPIVDGEVHSPLDELRKKTAGRNRMALSAPANDYRCCRESNTSGNDNCPANFRALSKPL